MDYRSRGRHDSSFERGLLCVNKVPYWQQIRVIIGWVVGRANIVPH